MRKPFFHLILLLISTLFFNALQAQTNENLFFVFLNDNPAKPQISDQLKESLQAEHMQNIKKLGEEGKLLAAGPFEGGGGIFILHAENLEQAKSYVNTDPAIQANRFVVEVFPFSLYNNDLCGAKEPYEMVTYQLIRLTANFDYTSDIDPLFKENRIFMANLNNENDFVIASGLFDKSNSGILILDLKTKVEAEAIIQQHPAVVVGQLNYEIKQLWIAKGTFCNK